MQVTVCWQEFSEAKIPYDPVMSADFADPEYKASVKSRGERLRFNLTLFRKNICTIITVNGILGN